MTKYPNAKGTATPMSATTAADGPTRRNDCRSDSSPASNNSKHHADFSQEHPRLGWMDESQEAWPHEHAGK